METVEDWKTSDIFCFSCVFFARVVSPVFQVLPLPTRKKILFIAKCWNHFQSVEESLKEKSFGMSQ